MIIVTGATGRLGRAVVERLADRVLADGVLADRVLADGVLADHVLAERAPTERVSAERVAAERVLGDGASADRVSSGRLGVSVREPSSAADLAARGIRVRRGDFGEPESLADAFEGATQVLIVSGPADPAPHQVAIDAAKAAGAERILYTSHQAANPDSLFLATRSHAATELDLAESGVPFTALRNGFYASTTVFMLRSALETGELILPEDGPVSWTAHRDLVDAAVLALTEPGRLDAITPALTGPELLDYADVAAIASDLVGRKITRVTVPDEEWKQAALLRGMPEFVVDLTLGIFAAARRGEFAVVDPTLPALLGRPATTLREVLAAELTP